MPDPRIMELGSLADVLAAARQQGPQLTPQQEVQIQNLRLACVREAFKGASDDDGDAQTMITVMEILTEYHAAIIDGPPLGNITGELVDEINQFLRERNDRILDIAILRSSSVVKLWQEGVKRITSVPDQEETASTPHGSGQ